MNDTLVINRYANIQILSIIIKITAIVNLIISWNYHFFVSGIYHALPWLIGYFLTSFNDIRIVNKLEKFDKLKSADGYRYSLGVIYASAKAYGRERLSVFDISSIFGGIAIIFYWLLITLVSILNLDKIIDNTLFQHESKEVKQLRKSVAKMRSELDTSRLIGDELSMLRDAESTLNQLITYERLKSTGRMQSTAKLKTSMEQAESRLQALKQID